ncbi:MAG: DUF6496 domain-containing protein [Tissierellia bacterium]|nr:DUF6496 domain-containing protein [Tissierellia bacterium]
MILDYKDIIMKKEDKKIKNAMKHPNVLGAGAKKRKKLPPKKRTTAVMKEWKRGTLHSGSGKIVKSKKQAIAIAISESKSKRK